jgi:hypothetical protein
MISHTWLKKLQYLECVPSNLLGRLIHGSFTWDGGVGTHPNDVDAWTFKDEQHIHEKFGFLVAYA